MDVRRASGRRGSAAFASAPALAWVLAGALAGAGAVGAVGCKGQSAGGDGGELGKLVEHAGEQLGGEAPGGPDAEEPARETAGAGDDDSAEPAGATATEIADLCGLYRTALRKRWDDTRTREEVRGLTLHSATALEWQRALAADDPEVALEASRAVVGAALSAGVSADCEDLSTLVQIADVVREAPAALDR